jgi:hypothetical protein
MKCTFRGHLTKFRGVEKWHAENIKNNKLVNYLDGFHHFSCRPVAERKRKIASEEKAGKNG